MSADLRKRQGGDKDFRGLETAPQLLLAEGETRKGNRPFRVLGKFPEPGAQRVSVGNWIQTGVSKFARGSQYWERAPGG